MSKSSRTGFGMLMLCALAVTAFVAGAKHNDTARRSTAPHDATVNTIRRLGVAVMYDDQQRRQQTSPEILLLNRAQRDGQF